MIPSWLAIALVTFAIAFAINRISPEGRRWFNRLRRPSWLTFEGAIPLIWIAIFICGAWSAYWVWETAPGSARGWGLMAFYLLVEVAILTYTPVMCLFRSLKVGTIIGATGFFLGLILTFFVFPISRNAGFLLLPYLLWSPIGTYVTWQMMFLNPGDA
jgi:tryptophan-rich sensory protein